MKMKARLLIVFMISILLLLGLLGCCCIRKTYIVSCDARDALPRKAVLVATKNDLGRKSYDTLQREIKKAFTLVGVKVANPEDIMDEDVLVASWQIQKMKNGFAEISLSITHRGHPVFLRETCYLVNAGFPDKEDIWMAKTIRSFYVKEIKPSLATWLNLKV